MSELQTIEAVLNGDTEAYAELIRQHHPRVTNLCLSFLLNEVEAEDAAQEAFVRAFASLKDLPKDVPYLAWVCRIASNHCLDLLRKRRRQKTGSLDLLLETQGDSAAALAEPTDSNPATRSEDVTEVLRLLSELPADYRQVLSLRELNELTYEEIADVMGCSLDSVKAKLQRARRSLQKKARHFLTDDAFTQ